LIVVLDNQGVHLRFLGGAEGTRTPDPHTASVVRYQLRHGPQRPALSGTRAIVHIAPAAGRIGFIGRVRPTGHVRGDPLAGALS
jgi:integrase